MITRIVKLPKHNNVLLGRDLAEIFEAGKVYEIREIAGEYIIKCLGDCALADAARSPEYEYEMYPNANSAVGAILQGGQYLMTKAEFKEIYLDGKHKRKQSI